MKTHVSCPIISCDIVFCRGAYIPYGQIDGFSKTLLERFWSLRHVNNMLRGKLKAFAAKRTPEFQGK